MADAGPDMTITRELRAATKDVHKITDVLVNAKFVFALSDDKVWADGLLSFYEIYKYLEQNLPENLLPKELHRTAEFEKDFNFFLGENWKEKYEIRPTVKEYLAHLEKMKEKNVILLFAYAFQMYMALMSGGQLLQKKRMIARKLWITRQDEPAPVDEELRPVGDGELENRPMPLQVPYCADGCATTYYREKISDLKAKLRTILNEQYVLLNDEDREAFIEESRNVFIFNAKVIRTVKGVNQANIKKLAIVLVFVVGIYLALKLARR